MISASDALAIANNANTTANQTKKEQVLVLIEMAIIKAAEQGKTSINFSVERPNATIESNMASFLQGLGYTVSAYNATNGYYTISW